MIKFLKDIFCKSKEFPQGIGVVKYPDKILFETEHQIKNRHWIRTAEITILDSNASSYEIGETIIKHLNQSKYGIRMPSDEARKEIKEKRNKITGLKTIKAQMQNSLYVSIHRNKQKIDFTPTINGGSIGKDRGYSHLPEESIVIDDSPDFEIIGLTFLQALEKCK